MKKRFIISILLTFIISIVCFFFAFTYQNQKETEFDRGKDVQAETKESIANLENQKQQNSVLIDKIENDPSKIAKEAIDVSKRFISVIDDNDKKSNEDKQRIFQEDLDDFVSDEVIENEDLTSLSIPDDYNIDVATYRGDQVPVLISGNGKYIVINYNSYNEEIMNITEYKKS